MTLNFKGIWNCTINSPYLEDGVGTTNDMYIIRKEPEMSTTTVIVNGSPVTYPAVNSNQSWVFDRDLGSGITSWVNEQIIWYNGTKWVCSIYSTVDSATVTLPEYEIAFGDSSNTITGSDLFIYNPDDGQFQVQFNDDFEAEISLAAHNYFFHLDTAAGIYELGDVTGYGQQTFIHIDDSTNRIILASQYGSESEGGVIVANYGGNGDGTAQLAFSSNFGGDHPTWTSGIIDNNNLSAYHINYAPAKGDFLLIDYDNRYYAFGDINYQNSQSAYIIDDNNGIFSMISSVEDVDSTYFYFDFGNASYKLGDLSWNQNQTFLDIDDSNAQVRFFSSGNSIQGRIMDLSLESGSYAIGDIDYTNNGDYLVVSDGTPGLLFYSSWVSPDSRYLLLDVNELQYFIGDIDAVSNGTMLTINDNAQQILFTSNAEGDIFFNIDIPGYLYQLGDIDSSNNTTYLSLDDGAMTLFISAAAGTYIKNLSGFGDGYVAVNNDGLLSWVGGLSASVSIGDNISDADPYMVLFTDASGNLAQNNSFIYDNDIWEFNVGWIGYNYFNINPNTWQYSLGALAGTNGGTVINIDDMNRVISVGDPYHYVNSFASQTDLNNMLFQVGVFTDDLTPTGLWLDINVLNQKYAIGDSTYFFTSTYSGYGNETCIVIDDASSGGTFQGQTIWLSADKALVHQDEYGNKYFLSNPYNQVYKYGDIDDTNNGASLVIDDSFPSIAALVNGGRFLYLDYSDSIYQIGDIDDQNTGLTATIDVGNNMYTIQDSNSPWFIIDINDRAFGLGDIGDYYNGNWLYIDDNNNRTTVYTSGGGTRSLDLNNGSQYYYFGDIDSSGNGSQLVVDDGDEVIRATFRGGYSFLYLDYSNSVYTFGDHDHTNNGGMLVLNEGGGSQMVYTSDEYTLNARYLDMNVDSQQYGIGDLDYVSNGTYLFINDSYGSVGIYNQDYNYLLIDPSANGGWGAFGIGDLTNLSNSYFSLGTDTSLDVVCQSNGNYIVQDNDGYSYLKIAVTTNGESFFGDRYNSTGGGYFLINQPEWSIDFYAPGNIHVFDANNDTQVYIGDVDQVANGTLLTVDDTIQNTTLTNSLSLSATQIQNTTASSDTIGRWARTYLYDPPGLVSSLSLALPTTPTDGLELLIVFGGTISTGTVVSSLTITASSSIVGVTSYSTVTAATCIKAKYISSLTKWFVHS